MLKVLKFKGIFVRKMEQMQDDHRFVESEVFNKEEGNEGRLCLDLFCLRILSLIVCRGHFEDKAIFLSRVISKNSHDGTGKYSINQGVYC